MIKFHKLFVSFIFVVLLLCTASSPNHAEAQKRPASAPSSFPKLGPAFNIWTDAKENTNCGVVYNPDYDEYLSIWSTTQDEWSTDLWARRIDGDGTLLPNFAIAVSAGEQLTFAGGAYSTKHDRYFVVFHNPSDAEPTHIGLSAVTFDYNGGNLSGFLTVDDSLTGVWGTPSVAYNDHDDEFVVVYDSRSGGCMSTFARRFNAQSGSPVGSPRLIGGCDNDTDRYIPSVAYNSRYNNFLVLIDYRRFFYQDEYVHAVLGSNDLGSLSPEYILSGNGLEQGALHVAAGRDEYLAVWSNYQQVYARRVNASGSPALPYAAFPISQTTQINFSVATAASGLGYWAVWTYMPTEDTGLFHIYGNFIPVGANQVLSAEFPIGVDGYSHLHPAITCSWEGRCLVTDTFKAGAAEDRDIRGRFLYYFGQFLPVASH